MQESRVLGILVAGMICGLGLAYIYVSSRNRKNYKEVGRVSKLYLHAVKSMSAIEVQEGELTDSGFLCHGVYDKSFMVIDEIGHFVTARNCPRMILIKPRFSDDKNCLILRVEGQNDISIPLKQNGRVTGRFSDDMKCLILSAEGQDDISIPLQQNGRVTGRSSDDKKCLILSAEGQTDISIPLQQNGIVISGRFSDDMKCLILSAKGQNDISIPLQQNGRVTGRFSDDMKCLILSVEGQDDISIPLKQIGRVKEINKDGRDCGDDVAEWLSDYLGGAYRMIYFSTGLLGKNLPQNAVFQYCGTFSLLSEPSVEDLNSRLEEKVSEKNFRPNIYVEGCAPYAEDFWKYVKVGDRAEMIFTHFNGRCNLPTLDQLTGRYTSREPLRTLMTYRRVYDFVEDPDRKIYAGKPIFGTFLDLETRGTIRVGDPVFATLQFQDHVVHAAKN